MNTFIILITGAAAVFSSCDKELIEYGTNDMKVTVREGSEWLHDFPLFMGIKKKNPPQIAVWMEDTEGNYLSTVYVTHKIATQSWAVSAGNRRKEALPAWCYARGVRYADGLYLPTSKEPFVDGISGATPQQGFDIRLVPARHLDRFVLKVEVNHSTDWNDHYPRKAAEGSEGYSGGKSGSGQPAVVYAAEIDRSSGEKRFEAVIVGHSSPDGTDGEIRTDTSKLTSALNIVRSIEIEIQ